jgi:hypothetical protein
VRKIIALILFCCNSQQDRVEDLKCGDGGGNKNDISNAISSYFKKVFKKNRRFCNNKILFHIVGQTGAAF